MDQLSLLNRLVSNVNWDLPFLVCWQGAGNLLFFPNIGWIDNTYFDRIRRIRFEINYKPPTGRENRLLQDVVPSRCVQGCSVLSWVGETDPGFLASQVLWVKQNPRFFQISPQNQLKRANEFWFLLGFQSLQLPRPSFGFPFRAHESLPFYGNTFNRQVAVKRLLPFSGSCLLEICLESLDASIFTIGKTF